MTDEQRSGLQEKLRGGQVAREIPFAQPGSLTKVFAIASGKGGVGKSSVTVNLAVAMARQGLKVGVVDADIYGHSVPAMLGVADERPDPGRGADHAGADARRGPSVISIGMLKPRRDQVVAWRGPMLDRALVQMLSDVFWGDLDVLLLDLPPGTGDVAISLGQHLPNAEVIVVTTPAGGRRRGRRARRHDGLDDAPARRRRRREHVLPRLPALRTRPTASTSSAPAAAPGWRRPCGSGSATTSRVLGEVPLDLALREGGDVGRPIVTARTRLPGRPGADQGRRHADRAGAAAWPACSSGSPRPDADAGGAP